LSRIRVKWNQRERPTQSYPPPCGEGIGGLRPPLFVRITPMRSIGYGEAPGWGSCGDPLKDPHPNPSPQGGGECTECAASLSFKHRRTCSAALCELLHTAPGRCLLSWRRHRAIGDGGRSPTAAPLGRFLPRLGPVGFSQRGLFRCDAKPNRSAHLLSSPRKRGPITTGSGIWVPAFAGTTSVYVMPSRAAGWCRSPSRRLIFQKRSAPAAAGARRGKW